MKIEKLLKSPTKLQELELRKKQYLDYMDASDSWLSVYWQDKLSEVNNEIKELNHNEVGM